MATPHLLRDLRKEQATLGDLHDTQVLLDRLDDLVAEGAVTKHQRVLLRKAARADAAALGNGGIMIHSFLLSIVLHD